MAGDPTQTYKTLAPDRGNVDGIAVRRQYQQRDDACVREIDAFDRHAHVDENLTLLELHILELILNGVAH